MCSYLFGISVGGENVWILLSAVLLMTFLSACVCCCLRFECLEIGHAFPDNMLHSVLLHISLFVAALCSNPAFSISNERH